MSKVLLVVDAQNDFMKSTGTLSVPGAESLIAIVNDFISKLDHTEYHAVLFTRDTHETEEGAAEGNNFPPHCMVGTSGWELSVDSEEVPGRIPTFFINKNFFDMWKEPVIFVTNHNDMKVSNRDALFNQWKDRGITEIEVIGVCSDICVMYAIKGILDRGFKVTVRRNMVKGLYKEIDQVVSDDFPEVRII